MSLNLVTHNVRMACVHHSSKPKATRNFSDRRRIMVLIAPFTVLNSVIISNLYSGLLQI